MKSETKLISKALKGKQSAFKILYANNVDVLFRYLSKFDLYEDEMKDLVQTTFIKAFNRLQYFEMRSKFSTWLFSICINELKQYKRKDNNRRYFDITEIHNEIDVVENDEIKNFEWQDEMNLLFLNLDEIKKTVFILFEIENYSHKEISEILNITTANSRVILKRVKSQLRNEIMNRRYLNAK